MQSIIITQDVVYGSMPQFIRGQKIRVSDKIADDLVTRGHAKYDQGEEAITAKEKEKTKKKKESDKKDIT